MELAILVGALGALFVVHELAVRIAARRCRIRLDRLGFPVDDPRGKKPPWSARLITIGAGAIAGYLVLGVLAFVLLQYYGVAGSRYVVTELIPGSPAVGKLEPGDRILAVDGVSIRAGAQRTISDHVNARDAGTVTFTVERAGNVREVIVEPAVEAGRRRVGIANRVERVHDVGVSARRAVGYPIEQLGEQLTGVGEAMVGSDEPSAGGPAMIAREFAAAFDPPGKRMLEFAIRLAIYQLLLLVVFDLLRYVLLAKRSSVRDMLPA